jgi:hypothetical protein
MVVGERNNHFQENIWESMHEHSLSNIILKLFLDCHHAWLRSWCVVHFQTWSFVWTLVLAFFLSCSLVGCGLLFGLQSFLFFLFMFPSRVFFPLFIYFYVFWGKISSNPRISRNLLFAWELWLDIFFFEIFIHLVVWWGEFFQPQSSSWGPICVPSLRWGHIVPIRLIIGRPHW